ncbi:MAG TPA: (2Fe-2S)-binding protein [Eubacteriales bacterium]|nr:(2Fe-2S)-binding protein [Eubacteriales bacterium]
MRQGIVFQLNGEETVYEGSATDRLLDVLREEYRLTGVKCGCKEGECGSCSVLIDDKLVNSCMVAMGRVQGSSVVTIEGFSKTERFKVLDAAYASVSAVQCGYCIPGMILASNCILSKNPTPTEADIREGISGNLCRCTGYNAIVKAIQIAAKEGEGLW